MKKSLTSPPTNFRCNILFKRLVSIPDLPIPVKTADRIELVLHQPAKRILSGGGNVSDMIVVPVTSYGANHFGELADDLDTLLQVVIPAAW